MTQSPVPGHSALCYSLAAGVFALHTDADPAGGLSAEHQTLAKNKISSTSAQLSVGQVVGAKDNEQGSGFHPCFFWQLCSLQSALVWDPG